MKILTALELEVVVEELNNIILNSKVSKIFLPKTKMLRFELHKTGVGKKTLIIDSGVGAYISNFKFANPTLPPAFAMFLRRHLNNSILKNIYQKRSERIIELIFQTKEGDKKLICELFGKGNFILVDKNDIIINSAVIVTTKTRNVRKGEIYVYREGKFDIRTLKKLDFINGINSWSDHKIVKFLAAGLALGGLYAEEVCLRAKVDKNKTPNELSKADAEKMYKVLKKLIKEFDNSIPQLVMRDEELYDAVPIKLLKYEKLETKPVDNFNDAVDQLLSETKIDEIKSENVGVFQKKIDKLEKVITKQSEAINKLRGKQTEIKKIIESIYGNYQIFSNLIEKIKFAKDSGHSWDEVEEAIDKSSGAEKEYIDKIDKINRIIKIKINELNFEIPLDSKLENVINKKYHLSKKFDNKISGAQKTLVKFRRDLEKLLLNKDSKISKGQSLPKKTVDSKKHWYEKFHWFYTSNRLLAVGGRDATSNEVLIKKHMEVNDLVFHTAMAGSPFFLLKEGKKLGKEIDISETAIETASYSRAWKNKYKTSEVFYVRPEQISKTPNTGEYLVKGSFMVRGKKQFINSDVGITIGIEKEKIIGGPLSAISAKTEEFVSVIPGEHKKSEISKQIAAKLGVSVDEIMKFVPNGDSEIIL